MSLRLTVSLLCGAICLTSLNGQPGGLPNNRCVHITGAGNAASGKWRMKANCETANGHSKFCKGGRSLEYWNNQINLMDDEPGEQPPSSFEGHCTIHQETDIFNCGGEWQYGNKKKPKARFDKCVEGPNRRRRLSFETTCWNYNDPRIISIRSPTFLKSVYGIKYPYVEFRARANLGCENNKPVYAAVFDDNMLLKKLSYPGWVVSYNNVEVECRLDDITHCQIWTRVVGGGILSAGTVYLNENIACRYMQTARDISFYSWWISTATNIVHEPLTMRIDEEERCFHGRPAWVGYVHDTDTSAIRNYVFYISFDTDMPGNDHRWIVTYDYITYNSVVYECYEPGNQYKYWDIKNCKAKADWLWLWEDCVDNCWQHPEDTVQLSILTTGPGLSSPPPVSTPITNPWNSFGTTSYIACTIVNVAVAVAIIRSKCSQKAQQFKGEL